MLKTKVIFFIAAKSLHHFSRFQFALNKIKQIKELDFSTAGSLEHFQ